MDADVTIIGAGVVGLAIAERVTERYQNVFVIEKYHTFGQETSSRNSEVIHAGIYYPQGSLKALLCVEGNRLLYEYCNKWNIPYKNCGKLIVATNKNEIWEIEHIKETAAGNGVELSICEKDLIHELEPNIFALKALYSPATGIIDTHSLMKRFETNIINNGGNLVYESEVKGIKKINGGYEITIIDSDGESYVFTTRILVNSAGLNSDMISQMAGIDNKDLRIYFCKGEYFRLKPPKNRLINRLVYPIPLKNMEGIGIHATIDMGGGVKLGPDVTYLESNVYDYKVDPGKQEAFHKSVQKFLPFIEYDDLSPEMAGIRPKIQKRGEPVRDFYIHEESDMGFKGLINLIGIESPGLTSAIAIGNYVLKLMEV